LVYRNDIQLLRGMAVFFVILFHLEIAGFQSGLLGVDVFFVISGYLMAMLFDKGSAKDFYRRRIHRLVPAYFVVVVITLLATSLITIPVDFKQAFEQSVFSLFFANNIGFWSHQSYFNKSEFNPLLNLWSLGVEAQYYLIVPLFLAYLKSRKIITISVFFLSLIACLIVTSISPKTSFFKMPFRVWEFVLGAIVA